jgi:hypothetical protein
MSPSFPLLPDLMVKTFPLRSLQTPTSPPLQGVNLVHFFWGTYPHAHLFHRHHVLHGRHDSDEPQSNDILQNIQILKIMRLTQKIQILKIMRSTQNIRILKIMRSMQNIRILKIMLRGLPINKIASTLCIYTIFTDNFAVCVGKQRVPVCHLSSQ